jgi:hypothetical protein
MNLGWLDADDLSNTLQELLNGRKAPGSAARGYSNRRRRAWNKARRRSEFNMWMGRAQPQYAGGGLPMALKACLVRVILVPGIRAACARQFTMHGLDVR